ncbi:MAG: response regulator transcription factor [Candidatus Eremiobacteraeota bacterium]|nr:response regulator transcription factor [Candidatus Eremiobacteraeota bacterium]
MIRILIVEDYQIIRKGIISSIVKESDIEIVAEEDTTEQAVERALELKPDVILMDLKLGDDDYGGVTAATRIKEKLENVKILILSFYDDIDHITRSIEAGVDGYLLKDVNKEDLIRAIRDIYDGKSVIHPTVANKMMKQMASREKKDRKKNQINSLLSTREKEVYQLLTKGLCNKDIAAKLFISEATVKAHISSILRKLKVSDRTQAVIAALRLNLFEDS